MQVELAGILLRVLNPLSTLILLGGDFLNFQQLILCFQHLFPFFVLLKAPNLFKHAITFSSIIFGFIFKLFPIPIEPLELVLHLLPHAFHFPFQVPNIVLLLDMFIHGQFVIFNLDLMFLLVFYVLQRFEIKRMAVIRGKELEQALGYLCVGLVLEMEEEFV